MEKKTIGSFLAALRKASGLTQKQLAEKLNVSDKAVSRWERDECAPDLSLIPVLAEIYGVTSDEILRGQRLSPDSPLRECDILKVEKQRKHLLRSSQNKFRIHSIISISIIVLGLFTAYLCGFELNRANLGFLLGSIFFASSIVFQLISTVTVLASIQDEDQNDDTLKDCRLSLTCWTEAIISAAIIVCTMTLTLAGVHDATPSFFSCLTEGVQYALIAAVICFAGCTILSIILIRREYTSQNRLRFFFGSALSILLIGVLIGHIFLNNYLINNRHSFAPNTKFTDIYAFRLVLERPYDPDGYRAWCQEHPFQTPDGHNEVMYILGSEYTDNQYTFCEADIIKRLTAPEIEDVTKNPRFTKELGYEFKHLNRYIVHYEISDTDKLAPIYTFNADQFDQSNQIATGISLMYALSYMFMALICGLIYLFLSKKIR